VLQMWHDRQRSRNKNKVAIFTRDVTGLRSEPLAGRQRVEGHFMSAVDRRKS
jgi:hypothetical protein